MATPTKAVIHDVSMWGCITCGNREIVGRVVADSGPALASAWHQICGKCLLEAAHQDGLWLRAINNPGKNALFVRFLMDERARAFVILSR